MPRDLASSVREAALKEDALQGMQPLTKSPDAVSEDEQPLTSLDREEPMDASDEDNMVQALVQKAPSSKRDQLHPYTQTLTLSDVESCVRLEEAAFPPEERCTREKFQYRLRRCGELSLGIFTSHVGDDIITAPTSAPVYSGAPDRKAVLLGHIVATRTTNLFVADEDMTLPPEGSTDPKLGHKEEGRTICIHSLAVLPEYQGRGLGTTLMKSYLQRLENQEVADRAALIAHEHLIPYYKKFGFLNKGKSPAQFGGGGWFDMAKDLRPSDDYDE